MDKSEAIKRLEYLKAKAQLALEQEVPEWIAEDVLGTIEAYDMAIEALQIEPERGEWICHKGKWIDFDYYPTKYECSQCHHYVDVASDKNFCPNCGADMRKESE